MSAVIKNDLNQYPLSDTPLCGGFGQYHTDNPTSKHPKPYNTITLNDVFNMVEHPQKVDKSAAQWVIFSDLITRESSKQGAAGNYYAVWFDFDEHTLQRTIKDVLASLFCDYAIYSSRSATAAKQKWRVIVPLNQPATAKEWQQIAQIINDKFEAAGIVPDRASERISQICYLPNEGDFYFHIIERNREPLNWQVVLSAELVEKQQQANREQLRLDQLNEASRLKAVERVATGNLSPIDAYNAAYSLEQSLEVYGYKRIGKKYLSPNAQSGAAGVSVKGDKWLSMHGSDSSIGHPNREGGGCHGDAFDLFTYYEHGGNRNAAIKAAGAMFKTANGSTLSKANQRAFMEQNSTANSSSHSSFKPDHREPDHETPLNFEGHKEIDYSTMPEPAPFDDSIMPPDDYDHAHIGNDALNYGGDIVTSSQPDTMPNKAPIHDPVTDTSKTSDTNEPPNIVYAKLAAHVERFNKDHAQVLIGGKHRIMRTVPAGASNNGRVTYEFLSQDALTGVYQNTMIQTGFKDDAKTKPAYRDYVTAWAKHSKCRTYTGGVIFKPNDKVPPDYFNTWQGFTVSPKQNSDLWALIKSHIDEVICASDDELIKYVYDWIAYTFQHPDKPAGAAIVLRGEQGTGKGSIAHFLSDIWGNHAAYISSPRELIGNFNGHLADTCFLFADEAFFSGDKSAEGRLKSLITEPNLSIERKGIDSESQPNYLKIVMATNNDWAVPADKDSRRYCVCDVPSVKIGDRDYFNSLLSDRKNKDVQAAFLFDMLNRDISSFHTGNIPDTDGLKAQRLHSLNSMGKWIVDSLNAGYFAIDDTACDWVSLATAKDLFSSYVFWCDNQRIGEHNRFTQTMLGKYLGDIGFEVKKGNACNHRQLGSIEDAIRKFEAFERVKIQLSTENG